MEDRRYDDIVIVKGVDESWIILVDFCEERSEDVDSVLLSCLSFTGSFSRSDILILHPLVRDSLA